MQHDVVAWCCHKLNHYSFLCGVLYVNFLQGAWLKAVQALQHSDPHPLPTTGCNQLHHVRADLAPAARSASRQPGQQAAIKAILP
jgi:hypothetical protein